MGCTLSLLLKPYLLNKVLLPAYADKAGSAPRSSPPALGLHGEELAEVGPCGPRLRGTELMRELPRHLLLLDSRSRDDVMAFTKKCDEPEHSRPSGGTAVCFSQRCCEHGCRPRAAEGGPCCRASWRQKMSHLIVQSMSLSLSVSNCDQKQGSVTRLAGQLRTTVGFHPWQTHIFHAETCQHPDTLLSCGRLGMSTHLQPSRFSTFASRLG